MPTLIMQSLVLFSCAPAQIQDPQAIEKYIKRQMELLHIPGLSLAINYNGKVCKKAWGKADLEWDVDAGKDTAYELASMSKPFVATAVMLLANDNVLRLDDKARKYLPELPAAWDNITIKHLLSHTSGVKEYVHMCEFSLRQEYSDKDLLDLAARYPLEFCPGDQYAYTNTGYCMLAMILERATGKWYGDILKERIFDPLQMKSTRVNDSSAIISKRAVGYTFYDGQYHHADFVAQTQLAFGDCGVISTIDDLILWDKEMWNDKSEILPKKILKQMWTPATLNHGGQAPYGLGWDIRPATGGILVSHGGAIQGFTCNIYRYLNDKLTVIILLNGELEPYKSYDIARDIANLAVGNKIAIPARHEIDPRAKLLSRRRP